VASLACVSVPGKLILMGEHAAVYGAPAIVGAVGMRLRAEVTTVEPPGVSLRLPGIGVRRRVPWRDLLQTTTAAREAWSRYAEDPGPRAFRALRGDDAARLVQLAVGETVTAVAGESVVAAKLPGLRVCLESEIPVGAGFGSSAAAGLAVVAAVCGVLQGELDWSVVRTAVREVERRQHGSPSGADAAAVLHGGVIHVRRRRGELTIEPLAARPDRLARLRVYSTGTPAESTGEVVAAVRRRRDADREGFEALLAQIQSHTRRLGRGLTSDDAGIDDLMIPIRGCHRCLCRLGVVPEPVARLVERIERVGGAAKISGAGSIAGPGAGSLLLVHPDPGQLERHDLGTCLLPYPVSIGVEGVRVEKLEGGS